MSDLLSPLLVVMNDEGHAYVSFCALMSRLKSNFYPDGKAMTKKFEHLSQGLLFYDPEFYAYLKLRHADDLLYCYRWLLLEMKREFSFEDSCSALEVLWSSLPPVMQTENKTGVKLYEHRFRSKKPPKVAYPVPYATGKNNSGGGGGANGDKNGPPGAIPGTAKRETVFTSVVSLRKRLTSLEAEMASAGSGSDSSGQSRARIQSAGSAEDKITAREKKQNHRRNQLTKSKSLLSRNGSTESGSSVPGAPAGTPNPSEEAGNSSSRKVNDLNDFYKLSPSSSSTVVKKVVPTTSTPSRVHLATTCNKGSEDNQAGDDSAAALSESDPDDEDDLSDSEGGGINYSMCKDLNLPFNRLPSPTQFGDGNPFLMFMCIACILQHRNYIMEQQLDYQEIAMFFDRMVRRHDVKKTLRLARKMFAEYLNDEWKRDFNSTPSDAFKPC